MKRVFGLVRWFCMSAIGAGLVICSQVQIKAQQNLIGQPYLLDTGLISRSISFENPTGAPGAGGKAASDLGPGRKGDAARPIKPGETVQLADIEGPGTIRHIWMTTRNVPSVLRGMVIRAWWDGQEHPSIECPLGDFFGCSHGRVVPYQSAVHSLSLRGGLNIWLPMPFAKRAKFTLTNEYASIYRWHLPDPIAWQKECRITIQQIAYKEGLHETADDWCCSTFWYEPTPSARLPAMPDVKARTADIWKD